MPRRQASLYGTPTGAAGCPPTHPRAACSIPAKRRANPQLWPSRCQWIHEVRSRAHWQLCDERSRVLPGGCQHHAHPWRTGMPHACCCYRLLAALFRCGDPTQLTRVGRCARPCLLTDMPDASNQTIKWFAPQWHILYAWWYQQTRIWNGPPSHASSSLSMPLALDHRDLTQCKLIMATAVI